MRLDAENSNQKICFWQRPLFFSALLGLHLSAFAQEPVGEPQLIFVQVEDLREDSDTDAIITDRLYFVLHDGSFDIFDFNQPASDALAFFASYGSPDGLLAQADNSSASTGFEFIQFPWWSDMKSPLLLPPSIPGGPSVFNLYPTATSDANQYFSFFTRIYPSDDAFIANEDPKRYKLFDENGQFAGPFVIDVYGNDILDAGTQINDEERLLIGDIRSFNFEISDVPLRNEESNVQIHPGFIGSLRSGEPDPGRIISDISVVCLPMKEVPGAIFPDACRGYEPSNADFSQPGYSLFRIHINASSRVIHGGWSGSYYDPARNGEGFSFEFFDENPDRVTMFWYTYEDDNSGDQEWLIGQGEKILLSPGGLNTSPTYVYEIDLYRTEGGALTSIQNPENVDLIPWGSARLIESVEEGGRLDQQDACERLRLFDIQPLDDDIELDLPISADSGLPFYELQRLGPKLSGAESLCGRRTSYPF